MKNKALGYYICNGVEFHSKVDACIYAQVYNKPIEWKFLDDAFNSYDWSIEPEQSLDALYDQRARELRERYDYIILSYSGGSDSNNILESFARQGLHIDEILTSHMTKATESLIQTDTNVTASWNFYAERKLQALPRLQYIHDHFPNTKITELDMSDAVFDSFKEFENERWALHRGDHLSIGEPHRTNYLHFGSVKKHFDKGQKVAFVVGIDKPNTILSGDNLYLSFKDRATNLSTLNDFNHDYTNVVTELFYWAESTMPLLAKQGHVIKRWLNHAPLEYRERWKNDNFETWRSFKEPLTRQIVYSTWREDWFQANKSNTWWHSEFDTWFNAHREFDQVRANWQKGLDLIYRLAPTQLLYDKNNNPDGLRVFSKNFLIGSIAQR